MRLFRVHGTVRVMLLQRAWVGEHGDRKGSPLLYTLRPPRHMSRSVYGSAPAIQKQTLLANGTTGTTMVIFRSKWRAREHKTEEKRRDVRFFCPNSHWPTESIVAARVDGRAWRPQGIATTIHAPPASSHLWGVVAALPQPCKKVTPTLTRHEHFHIVGSNGIL
jgi:hypothetical protein